jgi:hypothetical protein
MVTPMRRGKVTVDWGAGEGQQEGVEGNGSCATDRPEERGKSPRLFLLGRAEGRKVRYNRSIRHLPSTLLEEDFSGKSPVIRPPP